MASIDNLRSWMSWHYTFFDPGKSYWEAVGLLADDSIAWLRLALRTRFPSVAPPDALPEIAFNQHVDPPAPLMTLAQLRGYLADPWTKWARAATRGRFLDPANLYGELALLGFTAPQIITWRDLADGGNPGAFGGDTTCWYIDLGTGHPFLDPANWDDGTLWDSGATWDFTDPTGMGLINLLIRCIWLWSPAAGSCRYIQMTLPSGGVVRAPVYWPWEVLRDGTINDYYNQGY